MNTTTKYPATESLHHEHSKKRTIAFVSIAFVLLAVFATYFYLYKHNRPLTSAEVEQFLQNSSTPITLTEEEQIARMDTLQQSNAPATTSPDEREKMLIQLSQ